jgi:hypothetical protein
MNFYNHQALKKNFYNHQALKKLKDKTHRRQCKMLSSKKIGILRQMFVCLLKLRTPYPQKITKNCAPVSDSGGHAARAGCQWTQSRGDPRQNSPPSKGNQTKPYQTKFLPNPTWPLKRFNKLCKTSPSQKVTKSNSTKVNFATAEGNQTIKTSFSRKVTKSNLTKQN